MSEQEFIQQEARKIAECYDSPNTLPDYENFDQSSVPDLDSGHSGATLIASIKAARYILWNKVDRWVEEQSGWDEGRKNSYFGSAD